MKHFLIIGLALGMVSSASARIEPTPKLLEMVNDQGRELGLSGLDTLICFDENNNVTLGGFTRYGMSLFYVNGKQAIPLSEVADQKTSSFSSHIEKTHKLLTPDQQSLIFNLRFGDRAATLVLPGGGTKNLTCTWTRSPLE